MEALWWLVCVYSAFSLLQTHKKSGWFGHSSAQSGTNISTRTDPWSLKFFSKFSQMFFFLLNTEQEIFSISKHISFL